MNKKIKVAFHNLGCKVNSYELDAMKKELKNQGYEIVSFDETADVYVINTCSVTNIADRKSRQMISRARSLNPDSIVVATGCYVQTRDEKLLKQEKADLCVGNNLKGRFGSIIRDFLEHRPEKGEVLILKDEQIDDRYDDMNIDNADEHTRAFIKVQDGCNQFCTYCIIPFARGRVRSRKKEDVIEEVTAFAENGYREVVVTGIHLSSYGSDFVSDKKKADCFEPELLLGLLQDIADINGIDRIRLGSLEPRIITDDFVKRLSAIKKICPHFHLSLQSGCDETLKRMNRHYSSDEFYDKVCILRKYYEHPAITTDVIVGFPGETEEEFNLCIAFLKRVKFFEMHIFKYSKRGGTIAASMKGQLSEKEKSARSDVLEVLEKADSEEFRKYYEGRTVPVLFEEEKEIDGKIYLIGHTPEYVKVKAFVPKEYAGTILDVKINGYQQGEFLFGEAIENFK